LLAFKIEISDETARGSEKGSGKASIRVKQALLTAKEASTYLCVHPKTIYRWTDEGKIPFLKLDRLLRFNPREIEKWQNSHACRILPFPEASPKLSFPLAHYDRMHLKGGKSALGKDSKRWNYGFGAIYLRKTKRKKDRWYIDFNDGQGRRQRQVVRDAQSRGEALIALQSKVAEVFGGRFSAKRKREPMTFTELAKTYIEDYAQANKKSWRCDHYCLEAHLKPCFGRLGLEDVSPLLIEQYRTERLKSGVRKSTTNRELALLKKMFNLAIDWGFAATNPVLKVKLFSEKDNVKERILSEEEEVRLLAQCAAYLRPIVLAALNTGMRKNEILTLKWGDIDLKQRAILLTKTKSGKRRTIPINGTLLEILEELKAESESEYVFPGPGGRCLATVQRAFESACQRAGVKGLRFHDLRHTFGTRLIRRGVDIVTVQNLLGHYSVTVTQRYTHTGGEQKEEAVELLTAQAAKIPENLSHSWHTAKGEGSEVRTTPPFSTN
jgi:excisionase family DNA binding protein